jgi:polyhydroxybutyrate depolymerase
VSIIHFHSYEDHNVPWDGGVGDGISDHYNPPLDSVLNAWASFNHCIEIVSEQSDDVDVIQWRGCDASADVVLYLTTDGGHSWPMGSQPRKEADEPSQAVDANALMWAFFEEHQRQEGE